MSAHDLAHLFCRLHDALDLATFRAEVEAWSTDADLRALSRETEIQALDGSLRADAAEARVGGSHARRYAVLRGLDRAFAHVNPALTAVAPAALTEYALRYAEAGRLDTGAEGGALLPRFVRPGRRGQLPDDLSDAFVSVVRVPTREWDACAHVVLPAWSRLTRGARDGGLRVAATPLIADPDELHWEQVERGGRRFYRIGPADREATYARVRRVVRGFDEQGAVIAVAPELCLSPALLSEWRDALAGRVGAAASPLRLVLVGSGDLGSGERPTNTAVLLDAQTGEVVARQSKVYPFNFSPADLELWGLGDRFAAPIDEDLAAGRGIVVIEGGGLRLAILVCEDLARLHAFLPQLRAHGVSLILVPVFARPTKDRRWERARAEVYGDSTGCTIVVANSLVMATVLGAEMPAGTSIAVAPGHGVVGRCAAPDEVVLFSLEGGVPALVQAP